MVQTLIESTFNTQVYKWAGKVYKQRKGGPIGLRASGSRAKAAMEDWISRFEDKLGKLGIEVHLIRKYLDDVVIICSNLKLGSRFVNKRIDWSKS